MIRTPDREDAEAFPGTMFNGDGKRLAGAGPSILTARKAARLSFKALIHDGRRAVTDIALQPTDRFWVLPEPFDASTDMPPRLLHELVSLIRGGGNLVIGAKDEQAGAKVRDAILILLGQPGGHA
jgi:hypothetical protein